MADRSKIVILGAGMSGIACALNLYNKFDVSIYEKSRGVGGRLCAKSLPDGLFHFGAQFCSAQTSSFKAFLKKSNAIQFLGSAFDMKINSSIETKNFFVANDGMHSLLKKYEQRLKIYFNQKAIKIDEEKKLVYFESGNKESFDIIISSLPLPQAKEVFESKINHDATFNPCISVGMTISGSPNYKHVAYKNINEDISWLGTSKFYNKKNDETWVLQFSPDASLAMMSDTDSFIQTLAEDAVRNTINGQYKIMHSGIFKWKYALCSRSNLNNEYTYISKDAFAIGDWNLSPRVESAYISGNELGKYLTKNIL
jgi:renalase|tara:strand:- start:1652 stop:2587 length:936 start_codon:yes stop_codon:yes gene_type:complete